MSIIAGDYFGGPMFVIPPPLTDDEIRALITQAAADNAAKKLARKPAKMKTKKRAHKGA